MKAAHLAHTGRQLVHAAASRASASQELLSVEGVTVTAAEEMTAMEYATFFGYIRGFLAFFYAIGAATKFFSSHVDGPPVPS